MKPQTVHVSRPVFVVGSPRSGTSVLTWALGQHPNLLLTEESNWLGGFAVQAAVAHAQGSARGSRSQLGALGIARDVFLAGLGDAIDRVILAGRSHLEAASQATAKQLPQLASREFAISRDPREPKARWIDGTPEYSLQIQELLALFPGAQFVHILRDVDHVAASMLAFRDDRGQPIVSGAEAAYAYWMRTTKACIDAEAMLGPAIVHRVRHADLVSDGERTLREIMDFLGETFASVCLGPLTRRINSSFHEQATARECPGARSAAIDAARRSSAEWLGALPPAVVDTTGSTQWHAEFEARVLYAQTLETNWEAAQALLKRTRLAFAVSGALFLVNWLFALARLLQSGGAKATLWLALASAMVVVYAWLRRAGIRSIAVHVLHIVSRPGRRRE